MINLENLNENFKYYGNDVVVQIIDMFVDDHEEDMKLIEQNIISKDFRGLQFNAHHLKGSIVNFMDPVTTELSRKLEEMGETNTDEGISKTFTELQNAIQSLIQELAAYRQRITSCQSCAS